MESGAFWDEALIPLSSRRGDEKRQEKEGSKEIEMKEFESEILWGNWLNWGECNREGVDKRGNWRRLGKSCQDRLKRHRVQCRQKRDTRKRGREGDDTKKCGKKNRRKRHERTKMQEVKENPNGKHDRSIAKRKLYRRRWMSIKQRLSFFINKLFLKHNYHWDWDQCLDAKDFQNHPNWPIEKRDRLVQKNQWGDKNLGRIREGFDPYL